MVDEKKQKQIMDLTKSNDENSMVSEKQNKIVSRRTTRNLWWPEMINKKIKPNKTTKAPTSMVAENSRNTEETTTTEAKIQRRQHSSRKQAILLEVTTEIHNQH